MHGHDEAFLNGILKGKGSLKTFIELWLKIMEIYIALGQKYLLCYERATFHLAMF